MKVRMRMMFVSGALIGAAMAAACGPAAPPPATATTVVTPAATATPGPTYGPDVLANSNWSFVSVEASGVVTPAVAGSQVTLEFQPGGQAVGSGGCNGYGGDYHVTGNALAFGMLASTLRACVDTAVMPQEQQFMNALQGATGFTRMGDKLDITYPDGVLHFRAAA